MILLCCSFFPPLPPPPPPHTHTFFSFFSCIRCPKWTVINLVFFTPSQPFQLYQGDQSNWLFSSKMCHGNPPPPHTLLFPSFLSCVCGPKWTVSNLVLFTPSQPLVTSGQPNELTFFFSSQTCHSKKKNLPPPPPPPFSFFLFLCLLPQMNCK